MAQKRKRKKTRNPIFWIVVLILLFVASVIVYLVWDNYNNIVEEIDEPEALEQVEEDLEAKQETMIVDEEDESGKKVKQYEGDNPNKAEELSGAVTYAGVIEGKLMIRVNIDQYLGSGSCELRVLNGDTVIYNETANIVSSASTATCEGFDVSASRFDGGNYTIMIELESGDKTGSIRGEVSI